MKATRTFWTDAEIAILSRDYQSKGASVVASTIPRTLRSIHLKAISLGLNYQRRLSVDATVLRRIAELHDEGLTDSEIAAVLDCERHTVSRARRSMNLVSNRMHPRVIAKVAERTREQCRAAGVGSLAEVRDVAFRNYAGNSGWPSDLSPREVQVLEALSNLGPLTRPQLAEAVGMSWIGSRRSLKGRGQGGTLLSSLMRHGLVVKLGRLVRGAGRGKSLNLYSLAITAERKPQDA